MKICLKCKENKNLFEFNKNKTNKDGLQNYCKNCKRKSDKKWIEENPSIWKESNKNKNEKIKLIISNFRQKLGGICKKCNEKREHLLDFHHINPNEKEAIISDILNYNGFGEKAILKAEKELKKCILLCKNCHWDFHHLERNNKILIKEYLSNTK